MSDDCISRQAAIDAIKEYASMIWKKYYESFPESTIMEILQALPPMTPQQKIGYCKNCKYFEYDSVAKVNGIPLIVAHEICKRWGDGCKSKEDGYCFLFEPRESEVDE